MTSQKGQDRAPDVLDLGTSFARQAQAQDLLAPYKVATWDEIPDDQKDADGHWFNDYGGFISIGCNASVIAECPTTDGHCSTRSTRARSRSTATRRRPRPPSAACGRPRCPTAAASTTSARASTSS